MSSHLATLPCSVRCVAVGLGEGERCLATLCDHVPAVPVISISIARYKYKYSVITSLRCQVGWRATEGVVGVLTTAAIPTLVPTSGGLAHQGGRDGVLLSLRDRKVKQVAAVGHSRIRDAAVTVPLQSFSPLRDRKSTIYTSTSASFSTPSAAHK